ncbi:hypothetical protein OIE13_36030 [Streptosporangium sp. NBC_01810]|uniref:hypothetical protein n=1 Tax=Streptosporangium sp. NBC_01810 TaxID=2975951 RepID=UPI002DDA4F9B|nr:hypothetical protein [Streptosporangium sp. NBC_01810]WSA26233.1 hypothetical protein OIE13_36030 [Streptosporangium sp. NBC_01810]
MVVLVVAITAGLFTLLKRAKPFVDLGEGCRVTTPEGSLDLDISQAQVAAAIAAVAARRRLPERAAVIAYATAIQESKLENLRGGDRDSVGVFQQRPSQGWGEPSQLIDPVYASEKFFAELVKVRGYRELPLHEAAQAVQRSADGSAYAQHEEDGKILAAAFTGRVPKAVHCWFPAPSGKTPRPDTGEAKRELTRALGAAFEAPSRRRGWLVAGWSVAHAKEFGLTGIRYDGQSWVSVNGHDGWKPDPKASAGKIELS